MTPVTYLLLGFCFAVALLLFQLTASGAGPLRDDWRRGAVALPVLFVTGVILAWPVLLVAAAAAVLLGFCFGRPDDSTKAPATSEATQPPPRKARSVGPAFLRTVPGERGAKAKGEEG